MLKVRRFFLNVWFQKYIHIPSTEEIGKFWGGGVWGSQIQEIPEEGGVEWSIWFPDAFPFNMDSSIAPAVQKSFLTY